MYKIDFFNAHVKYYGDFEDQNKEEIIKAAHKMMEGFDLFDHSVKVETYEAAKEIEANNNNIIEPDDFRNIATVTWAIIDELYDEEEDE